MTIGHTESYFSGLFACFALAPVRIPNGDGDVTRFVAGGEVSSTGSLKVSYGVLLAVLDHGTDWEE